MENIQNGIIHSVYDMSNKQYLIYKQSDNTLKIIMRSIYLQNAKHHLYTPI
jgi:hypothetical protein